MKSERNDLKAGLFIVVSIALMIAVVVAIKGASHFLQPMTVHSVRFSLADNVGGLAQGDPVRIGGAKVGSIQDIVIDAESEQPGIVVKFEIPKRFQLHKNAEVSVEPSLTGTSVLNFQAMGDGAAIAEGDFLQGSPTPTLTSFIASASGLIGDARKTTMPKVNSAIDNAGGAFASVREKIQPIVERYNAVADSGKSALDAVGSLFGDTKPDFRRTVANLADTTGDIKQRLPNILEKVDGTLTKIQSALDKTNAALVDIQQTALDARSVMGSARSILTTNRGKIDAMIASLKAAGDNLKFATSEIRRSPWRLLYKPSPGEVANLNIYDSTRQFADGAGALSEAATALRDAMKDPSADPKHIQHLIDQLDKSFANFNEVESELWKKVQ